MEPTNNPAAAVEHHEVKANIEALLKKSTRWNRIIGYATIILVLVGTGTLLKTQEDLLQKNELVAKENTSLKSENQTLVAVQKTLQANYQAVINKPTPTAPSSTGKPAPHTVIAKEIDTNATSPTYATHAVTPPNLTNTPAKDTVLRG